jgi:hypothetical protein
MAASEETVICPHCGAENAKSPILTMCCKCLLPLGDAPSAAAASRPVAPVAPAVAPAPEYPPAVLPPLPRRESGPRSDRGARMFLGLVIGALVLGVLAWRLFGFARDLGNASARAGTPYAKPAAPLSPVSPRPQPMPMSAPTPRSVMVAGPLHAAAEKGDLATVTRLLDSGNAVDSRDGTGQTPLILAAYQGHLPVVKLLLERGASVTVRDAPRGRSALIAAATAPQPGKPPSPAKSEIMRLLIERGAPVADRDKLGWTVLHWASGTGLTDGVKMLLERKADPNARNSDNKTPLHEAAYWGRLDAARLLIAAGADVSARGTNGDTPLRYATERGHKAIVALLKEHGATALVERESPPARPVSR